MVRIFLKLLVKLVVQLIGVFLLIPVTYRYKLGEFPRWAKWWDDYRGRWLHDNTDAVCINMFGKGHCDMYDRYNSTWWGRYKWAAFRNACNYFQHEPLGKWYIQGHVEQYYGYIPLVFGLKLRYNIGYKFFSVEHARHMQSLGIPLQFVFSIGLRRDRK